MNFSEDEIEQAFKDYLSLEIDLAQAMKYCLAHKQQPCIDNLIIATHTLTNLLEKIRS